MNVPFYKDEAFGWVLIGAAGAAALYLIGKASKSAFTCTSQGIANAGNNISTAAGAFVPQALDSFVKGLENLVCDAVNWWQETGSPNDTSPTTSGNGSITQGYSTICGVSGLSTCINSASQNTPVAFCGNDPGGFIAAPSKAGKPAARQVVLRKCGYQLQHATNNPTAAGSSGPGYAVAALRVPIELQPNPAAVRRALGQRQKGA